VIFIIVSVFNLLKNRLDAINAINESSFYPKNFDLWFAASKVIWVFVLVTRGCTGSSFKGTSSSYKL